MTPAVAPGARDQLDRILTVPNLLTILRIGLVAGFAVELLGSRHRIAAVGLLMGAGVTDFLDGFVARHFGQVSALGKILDPVADRLTLITSVAVGVAYGAIPPWLAAVVLAREVLVSAAVVILALLGAARVDVTWLGKAATFGLYLSLPLFILGDGTGTLESVAHVGAYVLALPALVGSIAAAISYVPAARAALRSGRAARTAGGGVPPTGAAVPPIGAAVPSANRGAPHSGGQDMNTCPTGNGPL